MKKPNLNALIKNELVKRFESATIAHLDENKNSQMSLFNKVSELENKIDQLTKELSSLKNEHLVSYENVVKRFVLEKNTLKQDFDEQRRFIGSNINDIETFIKKATKDISKHLDKEEFNTKIEEIQKQIREQSIQLTDHQIDHNKNLTERLSAVKETHLKNIQEILSSQLGLSNKVDNELSVKINECFVNTEGFKKELNSYKKAVFIQEKKIESLYTLIEQLERKVSQ